MSPASSRPQLAWVTWLRLVGIFAIVSIHNAVPNVTMPRVRSSADGLVGIAADLPFVLAMPVLVMISGTLALDPSRYRGAATYLRRRSLRIVVPLVFWHACYVALYLWLDPRFPRDPGAWLTKIASGTLAWPLYFYWIILGLSVVTPLLIGLVRRVSPAVLAGVAVGCAAWPPLLTVVEGATGTKLLSTLHNPLTWWLPYLGYYLLGWVLRDVVLTGVRLLAVAVVTLGAAFVFWFGWRNPAAPTWLPLVATPTYYSLLAVLSGVAAFLVGRAMLRDGGVLEVLTREAPMRAASAVGAVTLGVWGIHMGLLEIEWRVMHLFGPAATSWWQLGLRWALVSVVATAVCWVASKIPLLRRVV